MNRLRSILLLSFVLLLFTGSVGVNIFKHICEEDGVSISYFVNAGDEHCSDHVKDLPPCCEKEEENKDCCNDEVDHFQFNLDFCDTHQENKNLQGTSILSIWKEFHGPTQLELSLTSNYANPPPLSSREILLKKQVLVI